ncbi:MAG TPA: glycerol-3-phosphate 1-O-acyltransferase PlsY [Bryobacteraceae bacterium]|nr:glycerol-3-phosphate 1-O-acyltransferase PlsY [Bryobacteraceae bacterium]
MTHLLAVVAAYLIGGIPFGYLLVRLKTGGDVRASGSGNIGATNVLRTAGRVLGLATLLLDIAKGYFAVWLTASLTDLSPLWTSLAAVAVILGHAFPVFLKFQGGKAVASFVGAFLYLCPLPLLGTTIVFVAAVAVSRHISLGSILGAATFPLAVYLIQHPSMPVLLASIFGSAFVIWRHKANIARLRAGKENVFRFKGAGR